MSTTSRLDATRSDPTAAHGMTRADDSAARRLAAGLFAAGALLLVVGNLLHPLDPSPSATSRFALAEWAGWIPVHLGLATGFLAVAAAMVLLAGSVRHPTGRPVARLSGVTAVVGGTLLFTVFGGLDGYAVSHLASVWNTAGASGREALEPAAIVLDSLDTGVAALGTLALLGFGLLALGIAIVLARFVPRWLGGVAVVLGLLGTVTGVALAVSGATGITINLLLRPLALATTIYFLVLAVALRRTPVGGSRGRVPATPRGR